MVSFLLGSAASNRLELLYRAIGQSDCDKKILIVPEQDSFRAEQKILALFGKESEHIEVFSFTRLAHQIFKTYGGLAGNYANRATKTLMMDLTLHEIPDRLVRYRSMIDQSGFSSLLLETVEELKNSGFTPESFYQAIVKLPDGQLRQKAFEFADIFRFYNARLLSCYRDPSDDLKRAAGAAEEHRFFHKTAVFFDAFLSFSGAQYRLIQTMMEQADLTFCICCEKGDPLFEPSQRTVSHLISLATAQGVEVKKPIYGRRLLHQPDELQAVERNILRARFATSESSDQSVQVILAPNEYAEVDTLLVQVLSLVKQGFRYSDIVVVTRDMDSYRGALLASLQKYHIPYFLDEKQPASFLPLFQCCLGLLESAFRFQIETVLQFLKSNMTGLSAKEIASFENYVYTWNIKKEQLFSPFTHHPRGFTENQKQTAQDVQTLRDAQRVRTLLSLAFHLLQHAEETAPSIAEALIRALKVLGVPSHLKALMARAPSQNHAAEIAGQWDLLIELLENLAEAAKDAPLSLARFYALFVIAVEDLDVGRLPKALDALTIGTVERTVLDHPRAVFILGANDGIFPYTPRFTGIFTNADRYKLAEYDIRPSKSIDERVQEERLLSYQALCSATEFLCVSARMGNIAGDPLYPSEVVTRLIELFGKQRVMDADRQPLISLCQTDESSFLQLALHYRENTAEVQSLKAYFHAHPKYRDTLLRLEEALDFSDFSLRDKNVTDRLFSLRLSPSQIEQYYQCPFSYFCRYGLCVKPIPTTELDAPSLGSTVHYALEKIVSNESFLHMDEHALKQAMHREMEQYLQEHLGGREGKSARFLQVYQNTTRILFLLCQNIQQEFSTSRYRPAAFELEIGENAPVPPMDIPLDSKHTAQVGGKIDRVDTCVINGRTYLRIIDYKTGNKVFQLSELYQGLNLQMLLYLFSIYQSQEPPFDGIIPAGILYIPASGALKDFVFSNRNADIDDAAQAIQNGFRANGLILDFEENQKAMENIPPGCTGKFLPLRVLKTGEIHASDAKRFLVTSLEMDALFVFVRKQVQNMCRALLGGQIGAHPVRHGKHHTACEYCDYHEVCGHLPSDSDRTIEKMDKQTFFNQIAAQLSKPPK